MVFAVIATAAAAAPKGVPLSEALSGIFGSISMAAWMCLMVWPYLGFVMLSAAIGMSRLTDFRAASPVVCQLQSTERRWHQHGIPDCLDAW